MAPGEMHEFSVEIRPRSRNETRRPAVLPQAPLSDRGAAPSGSGLAWAPPGGTDILLNFAWRASDAASPLVRPLVEALRPRWTAAPGA